MWSSTIPDAIDALYTLWSTDSRLSQAWVVDGVPVSNDSADQVVTVGYDGNENSVTATTVPDGFAADPNLESYTVHCSASVVVGDSSQKPARDQAFALYRTCCDALAVDWTLGQRVLQAVPSDVTVRQSAGSAGRACTVLFGIAVRAYTKES